MDSIDSRTGGTVLRTTADLGRLIKKTRNGLKLRQAKAAALCGVGTRFFSELENGKPSLHMDKVLQVMTGLGLLLEVMPKGAYWAVSNSFDLEEITRKDDLDYEPGEQTP